MLRRCRVPRSGSGPLVGSIIRLIIRSVVVLPQPDGPTITVILPVGTVRVRSTTAAVPSRKVLLTDSNLITPKPRSFGQNSLPRP